MRTLSTRLKNLVTVLLLAAAPAPPDTNAKNNTTLKRTRGRAADSRPIARGMTASFGMEDQQHRGLTMARLASEEARLPGTEDGALKRQKAATTLSTSDGRSGAGGARSESRAGWPPVSVFGAK